MAEKFSDILAVGKINSLGRAEEVVAAVLQDQSRIEELYQCLFEDDAWLRMRAVDSLEKVCRVHPQWLEPYVDRLMGEFGDNTQPSIQWHMAEIFIEVDLTPKQRERAINWLIARLKDPNVDWIVAANCMSSLTEFTHRGSFAKEKLIPLLELQQSHKSNAVKKRAAKLLHSLSAS